MKTDILLGQEVCARREVAIGMGEAIKGTVLEPVTRFRRDELAREDCICTGGSVICGNVALSAIDASA